MNVIDKLNRFVPLENRIPLEIKRGEYFSLDDNKIYVVTRGAIACQHTLNGQDHTWRFATADMVVAFPGRTNTYPRWSEGHALVNSEITAYTVDYMHDEERLHAALFLQAMEAIEHMKRVETVSKANLPQKIPAWLLYLSTLLPPDLKGRPQVLLTQAQFAKLLWVRRESLSTELTKMRESGAFEPRYARIVLLDLGMLRNMAGPLSLMPSSPAVREEDEVLMAVTA